MRRVRLVVPLLLASVLGAGLLPMSSAQAADNGSWAIVPAATSSNVTSNRAFFNIESAPGQVITDSVRITNVTQGTLTLDLYPADAFNSGGGGFALRRQDEVQEDLGTWITLEKNQVVLEPEQSADVGFTMTVPAGASPGDHVGGIVALNPVATGEQTTTDGAVIQVQQAVGVRIYTRIAGPLNPSLVVNSVDLTIEGGGIWGLRFPERAIVTYTVSNPGNVAVNPDATVALDGAFGRELDSVDVPMPEILPGNDEPIVFQQVFEDPAMVERIKASVTVTAEDDELVAEGDDVVWMVPWLIVLGLLGAGLGWFLWRRRREATEPDSEDLASIRDGAHAGTGVQ